VPLEKEHVIPRNLYRALTVDSRVQRITVPACATCNRGWSSAEPHFRSVLLLAGEPNDHVNELWRGPTRRSFLQPDGLKRIADLAAQLVPRETDEGTRHVIYPDRDPQVMLVIRKIIRGLAYFHGLPSPVADERVRAEILKTDVPEAVLEVMQYEHREAAIFDYRFIATPIIGLHSFWLLRFFERRVFVGHVIDPPAAADAT
jgi:hypothetical protein